MKTIEKLFWNIAIKILHKSYGIPCPDYAEECVCCRAGKTVQFIREHIELI